jgi:outer membrane usher protein
MNRPPPLARVCAILVAAAGLARPAAAAEALGPLEGGPPRPAPPSVETGVTAPAATDQEVFEQVFGRLRRGPPRRITLPLFVDAVPAGEILVDVPDAGGGFRIAGAPLLQALASRVHSEVRTDLKAAIDDKGQLSDQVLRRLGMKVSHDARKLQLHIGLPPGLRETAVLDLRANRAPGSGEATIEPSTVSGFLNVRGAQAAGRSAEPGTAVERRPFRANLDGALQVRGWVLEGYGDAGEERSPVWRRGDVLLTRDDTARALRYALGDFSLQSIALQPAIPIAGIGLARNFSLQPYRATGPISDHRFLLERPSEVEIGVNGVPVRTLSLPAGRHDIRDLPFSAGVNEVTMVIKEDVGVIRRLSFSAAMAGDLLAPGLHQFAYSFGAPLSRDVDLRAYHWTTPLLSMRHRVGLTQAFTGGGYFDATRDRQMGGAQATWATRVGNVAVDLGASDDELLGADAAVGLRYDYLWSGRGTALRRVLTANVRHSGPAFRTLDPVAPGSDFATDLSLSASSSLVYRLQGSFDLGYQIGRPHITDAQSASLAISRYFADSVGVSLNLTARNGGIGPRDVGGFLNVHWHIPHQRQSLYASTRTSTQELPASRAGWSYHAGRPAGATDATAAVTQSAASEDWAASLEHAGSRGTAALSHTSQLTSDHPEMTGAVSAGSAIVFAGGRFAVSRPVTGAFAIVAPNHTLAGHTIGVNPTANGEVAQTDWLGPAVIPNLQPHHPSAVTVAAPDLPVGYSLGPSSYWLIPRHKSGTLLVVGEEGTVSLRGTLRHQDGRPVALASGELIAVDAARQDTLPLFTNRAGRFGLEAVRPGRYLLRLSDESTTAIELHIPAGQVGSYSVGTISVAQLGS